MAIEKLFSDLIVDKKLTITDDPFLVENFIDIKKYISWDVLNDAINNDFVYWEILDFNGNIIDIPFDEPYWFNGLKQQNKSFIIDHINAGYTFKITKTSILTDNLKLLTSLVQDAFFVSADIHIYGSKGSAKSFDPHTDMPANFIIQVDGETDWIIFKNKVSSLLKYNHRDDNIRHLEPMLEHTIKPGDLLYIPSKYYHCALPDAPRLSISIPCFSDVNKLPIDTKIYNVNG